MRRRIALIAVLIAVTAVSAANASTDGKLRRYERQAAKHESVLRFFNNHAWMTAPRYAKCWQVTGWQRRRVCRIARSEVEEHTARLANVRRMIEKLTAVAGPIGNVSAWNCIHGYEDGGFGWTVNTGNGYYGGLQMDLEFQRDHGLDLLLAKGTADNWTPYEQMVVAQRAHDGVRTSQHRNGAVYFWKDRPRGYHPWPNTARWCGLL